MLKIEKEIKETQKRLKILLERKSSILSKRHIKCAKCENSKPIKDIDLLSVLEYIPPHGCSGGDYWIHSEYNYICNGCGVRNRFLFNSNYKINYRYRGTHTVEAKFFNQYKDKFNSVTDIEGKKLSGEWINNYYVDRNIDKFFDEDTIKEIEVMMV